MRPSRLRRSQRRALVAKRKDRADLVAAAESWSFAVSEREQAEESCG
jgi:hypothetical protein